MNLFRDESREKLYHSARSDGNTIIFKHIYYVYSVCLLLGIFTHQETQNKEKNVKRTKIGLESKEITITLKQDRQPSKLSEKTVLNLKDF